MRRRHGEPRALFETPATTGFPPLPPAVVVHGLAEARAALAPGRPVTLLSAPGAALYAGCGWWAALVRAARAEHPATPGPDILDCADGTGLALAALRIGLHHLVLWPGAPGREAVATIAAAKGGFVLAAPPVLLGPSALPARRGVPGPPGARRDDGPPPIPVPPGAAGKR